MVKIKKKKKVLIKLLTFEWLSPWEPWILNPGKAGPNLAFQKISHLGGIRGNLG